MIVTVPGARRGGRARVASGVLGRVVGVSEDGRRTIVDVKLSDLERMLAKCPSQGVR